MRAAHSGERALGVVDLVFFFSGAPLLFYGAFFAMSADIRRSASPGLLQACAVAVALALLSGGELLRRRLRKDRVPDGLPMLDVVPLEAAGVQLLPGGVPGPSGLKGPVRLWLFFQNRYAAVTTLQVRLKSREGGLSTEWSLEIPPAQAGFVWRDLPLGEGWKPGRYVLDVEARGSRGRGPQVRFGRGRSIRSQRSRDLETFAHVAHGTVVLGAHPLGDHVEVRLQEGPVPPLPSTSSWEGRLLLWSPEKGALDASEALRIAGLSGG